VAVAIGADIMGGGIFEGGSGDIGGGVNVLGGIKKSGGVGDANYAQLVGKMH